VLECTILQMEGVFHNECVLVQIGFLLLSKKFPCFTGQDGMHIKASLTGVSQEFYLHLIGCHICIFYDMRVF